MEYNFENNEWLYNPNLYRRSGCVLQVDGIGFEPEEFLRQTTFDPNLILFYGKLGFPEELKLKVAEVEPSDLQLFETTILLLEVSQAETKTSQISEATSFFERYRNEVKRLQGFPQVENIALNFRTAENESSQVNLPNEFSELAAGCGVTAIMF